MNPSRIDSIQQMLVDEPDDLFLRYALAMEYRKAGRVEESIAAFATLMDDDPPHVPAFFMAAQLLAGTGEVGLMGLHADEILELAQLPMTYATLSTCFRREAGAAGKEGAGLYRVHLYLINLSPQMDVECSGLRTLCHRRVQFSCNLRRRL